MSVLFTAGGTRARLPFPLNTARKELQTSDRIRKITTEGRTLHVAEEPVNKLRQTDMELYQGNTAADV